MFSFFKKHKRELILFVLILTISFGLRFLRVIFDKQPVFGDEAIYIRWSQIMRVQPSLRFVPQSDGKQPLFMWATIPFLKIFKDPLVGGRMLSVYAAVITTAGVFFLTLLLFKSKKTALIAAVIYALSPFSVFFDSMALSDSMLSMFGVWVLVFGVITIRKVRLDSAMFAGFSLGGALLTKSPGVFFAALTPLTLILYAWPKKLRGKFERLSVFVFLFTITYAIAYGMYNILRLGENFHMISLRNKDYVYPFTHFFESPLNPLVPFLRRVLQYIWFLGPGILILLLILGATSAFAKHKKETLLLLSWTILPILAVSEFSKTITARYVYFALPYFFILAATSFGFVTIKKRKIAKLYRKPGVRMFVTLCFSVFIAHSLFVDYQLIRKPQVANLPRDERSGYFEEWTAGYGIKEASELIRTEFYNDPSENIIVGTEGYFGTLPDGLQIYLNDIPEITVIGVGIDLDHVPESLSDSANFGNKTYFLINNSRLKVDYHKLGLELIAAYPKALREKGTLEYNLHGPQEVLYLFEVKPSAITD